jgi:hypothetical protein
MLNVANNGSKRMDTVGYGQVQLIHLIYYLSLKSKLEIFILYSRFMVMNDNE